MRLADRVVAGVLVFLGIVVAWKSTELPIGILPREGPGGGFLPFWLSLGISAAAAGVFIQSYFGASGEETRTKDPMSAPFITWEGFLEILRVGVPGLVMILVTSTISIYFASAAFVFYVLHFVGRHSLRVCISVAIGVPIAVFFIFEKFLIIPLPKGYLEPLFYLEWPAFFKEFLL